VKGDVSSKINDLFGNILGVDATDILSGEEIDGHLNDAFNKFDANHNGKLDQWEFTQACFFLGLKGSEDEIAEAFRGVDVDDSGFVDMSEFMAAIKGERLLELSLGAFLEKMGVEVC